VLADSAISPSSASKSNSCNESIRSTKPPHPGVPFDPRGVPCSTSTRAGTIVRWGKSGPPACAGPLRRGGLEDPCLPKPPSQRHWFVGVEPAGTCVSGTGLSGDAAGHAETFHETEAATNSSANVCPSDLALGVLLDESALPLVQPLILEPR
jgi:hypothetical protein